MTLDSMTSAGFKLRLMIVSWDDAGTTGFAGVIGWLSRL